MPSNACNAASKLQRLLVLESEHGPLPGTRPALTDVLHYLNKVYMAALYQIKLATIVQIAWLARVQD